MHSLSPGSDPRKVRSACQRCRQRRIKCDRRTPSCSKCARAGVTCIDVDSSGSRGEMPRAALADALTRVKWLEDLVRERLPDVDLSATTPRPTPPAPSTTAIPGPHVEDDESPRTAAFDVGLISFNLCVPRLHYLGASSGSLFAKLLRSDKGINTPITTGSEDSYTHPVASGSPAEHVGILALIDELRTILPTRDECDRLVRLFLFHYHPIYPILHWPSLYALVAALYASIETSPVSSLQHNGWPAHVAPFSYNGELAYVDGEQVSPVSLPTAAAILLSVLCASSYLQAHNTRFGPDPRRYDDKAFALTSAALAEISLTAVQLAVLSPLYKAFSASGAVILGLNRLISAIHGRPLSFQDDGLDLTMPVILAHPGDEVSESDQAYLSYSNSRFHWACLVSEIISQLYQSSSSEMYESTKASVRSSTHARLDAWLADAQQAVESLSKPNTSALLTKARIDYHHAIALLYQPSVAYPHPDTIALRHCFESATKRVHLFWSLYEQKGLILSWPTAHGISLAGTTLAYCVWASEEIRASLSVAKLSADLRLCSSLLTLGGGWWESARKGSQSFQRLANLTIDSLFGSGEHAADGGVVVTGHHGDPSNDDVPTTVGTSPTNAKAVCNLEDTLYSFLQPGFDLTDMPGLSPGVFEPRVETGWDSLLQSDYQLSDDPVILATGIFEPPS